MPPKARPGPARPVPDSQEEDDDLERLESQITQMSREQKETQEAMERQRRLMLQQQEEAKAAQQEMIKRMEELTNRLSPLTSLNPTPATTPPPPNENEDPPGLPVPLPIPRTYELPRTPTIPSIDNLKGRSNYKTWTINIKLHARNLHVWQAIQGQPASEEQEDLAQSLIGQIGRASCRERV